MSDKAYDPIGYRVLVKFLPVQEQSGIIIKATETVSKEQQAQVRAELVAMGPNAFEHYQAANRPEPGDILLVAKYGGFSVPDADGNADKYLKVYNDEDVAAIERSV